MMTDLDVKGTVWMAMVAGLMVSTVMTGNRNPKGWLVAAIVRVLMVVWAGYSQAWGLVNTSIVFLIIDMTFYRKWCRERAASKIVAASIASGQAGDAYDYGDDDTTTLGARRRP